MSDAWDTGVGLGQGKHRRKRPQPQPPAPPPPPPAGKPSRVYIYASGPTDYATDLAALGITDAFHYIDPALLWSTATLKAQVQDAAQRAHVSTPGVRCQAVTWSFGPGNIGVAQASEALWVGFCERVDWLRGTGVFSGITIDSEPYAPASPWHPVAAGVDMRRRGMEFAQACGTLERGCMVPFYKVRAGLGIIHGNQPQPWPAFFRFWNFIPGLRLFDEDTYTSTTAAWLPLERAKVLDADLFIGLPYAQWIPGIWAKPENPLSIMAAFRQYPEIWWYVDAGQLAGQAARIKAALR